MLGITGTLVAAVGASYGIGIIWGGSNVPVPMAAALFLVGIGMSASALLEIQPGWGELWPPIGAAMFFGATRFALLRAFSAKHHSVLSPALTVGLPIIAAVVCGLFVHLALQAHLQRRALRNM